MTPAVLTAVLAGGAALWFPRRAVVVRPALLAGAALLLTGAALSLLGSDDPTSSALLTVVAVSAPMALFASLLYADIPLRIAAGAFVVVTCVLMLRADAVFVQTWGFPTLESIFTAKFTSTPYDFHYYGLGNPDHTAGFLLMPFAVALLWSTERGLAPVWKLLALTAAALLLFSLVLLYSRSALVVAFVLVLAAILVVARGRARYVSIAAAVAAFLAFAVAGGDYLLGVFSTSSTSAGGERVASLTEGLSALAGQPLTGVGLGRYGPANGYFNAHSSVIQAAAEMGVVGLSALVLLTSGLVAQAVRYLRLHGPRGPFSGAALGVGVYAVYATLAAPANEGLYSGYVSVWALSVALLLAMAHEPQPTARPSDAVA